uniref:Endonuclease/exonuclease/phosphatase domain-containing protein n=1 Tax=Dendroctonus ponderosae TaxID=77166 RepID=A0AAR5PXW6_DENPD
MVVTKMQNFFPHSFIHGRYILRPSVPAAPMSLTKRVSRKRPGHKGRQLMHIASYNVQTLSSEANILEIEVELNDIKWDIVGVSEVKRRGEDQITLRSGHTFHFKGEEDSSGGVGFFVHKKHIPNLKKIECVSPRDIAVLSEISVGSDHRMIRAKTCFNVKRKKTKMILTNKSKEWKSPETITEYQQVVTRILEAQEYMEETDIEEMNNNI